ncbi:MAG: DUF1800 family protein [Verrucomicrobiota bacterium]
MKILSSFSTVSFLAAISVSYAVDSNNNQLSDVWEQFYNDNSLLLLDDDDFDRFTNFEEYTAGTDPNDSEDYPRLFTNPNTTSGGDVELIFQTLAGKAYILGESDDLSNFDRIAPVFLGDGVPRNLVIDLDGLSRTPSPIRAGFWANADVASMAELANVTSYPFSPDGVSFLPNPEAPVMMADGYGARFSFWITPPETGPYTFFLSAGGSAELYFGSSVEDDELLKIAEILPDQTGLIPGEWDIYGTQRASPIELVEGTPYFVEVCYLGAVEQQHVEIGWSGPALVGIEKLDRSHLAEVYFLSTYFNGSSLFEYDYDSNGNTALLWPQNTALEPGPAGMSGNVERMTGDPGASSQDERIVFTNSTSEHLYATWLFNMASGHDDVNLFFMNGSEGSQEGPRINLEERSSGTTANVRAGSANGTAVTIPVEFGTTFRVEIVATLSDDGFDYATPEGWHHVAKDTFDIFVSDTAGHLVGSAHGLEFRDGPGVVQQFSTMRAAFATAPNIVFDDWEFTDGQIKGSGFLLPNTTEFNPDSFFFNLEIEETDGDGDTLSDWEELALAAYYDFHFFDPETTDGLPDAQVLATLLNGSSGTPEIALYATDAAAYESNYPNTIPDYGEITITRTGALVELTVELCVPELSQTGSTATVCNGLCCMLIGSAGDEAAETSDYQLIDEDGNIVTNSILFEFGETTKKLTVVAVNDSINEYPETLNLAVETATDGRYTISSTQNGASIQLFDLPDSPDNLTIFTGSFSPDGRSVTATNGSGFVTATLNGPRTELRVWAEYSSLTSNQQDAHIHKANPGTSPSTRAGDIVYAITEIPGDDESPPLIMALPTAPTDLTRGALVEYPWDISSSSGAVPTGGGPASKQAVVDSLFGQNGETPLYFNVHSVDNPAGEIWAFLSVSGGSIQDPGDAEAADSPGSGGYPQLTGDLLEADIWRFLNQATFGATVAEVETMLGRILTERTTNPSYHRHEEFEAWIDAQMDPAITPQAYILDYLLASHFQRLVLGGFFDPALNPTDGTTPTPTRPATWPTVNRDDPNPEYWYLSDTYPATYDELELADTNDLSIDSTQGWETWTRPAISQMMLNGRDQLRQKMGYALQQIVVISSVDSTIARNYYGYVNYQDQLNYRAFSHYRDVLGYVNWSPIMARWLSSLQNQPAIDFDGDGLFDSYPDENLARENMQLFSIGLFEIWPDGSLKLTPGGLPQATYTNEDIREFAKILTGQSFSVYSSPSRSLVPWGGQPFSPDNEDFDAFMERGVLAVAGSYPMKMFPEYHSLGKKSFAGTVIDHSDILDLEQQAIADIESAMDWLAGKPGDGLPDYDMVSSHVSTPAFISRRLIQRFTTSNPSRDYLHRVSTTFKNSEGDLGLTLKAILLDPEARTIDLNDTVFGLKKSPLDGYLQMIRSLEFYNFIPLTNPNGAPPYDEAAGDYSNPDLYLENFQYPASEIAKHERNFRHRQASFNGSSYSGLGMNPLSQPTVFNYYLPDFSPSGPISNAGLVAPEMQLASEPAVVSNINFFADIIRSSLGYGFTTELGGSDSTQEVAFNSVDADEHDIDRLPRQRLADLFYPATPPTPVDGRTSESLADEILVDELDRRLTYGFFKMKYPYDPSDDDDPNVPGVDDLLKNPRELIIDAITYHGDPYNGSDDDRNRRDKFSDALYLLTYSPEYQIRK